MEDDLEIMTEQVMHGVPVRSGTPAGTPTGKAWTEDAMDKVNDAKETIKDKAADAGDTAQSWGESIKETVFGKADDATDAAADAKETIKDKAADAGDTAQSWGKTAKEKVFGKAEAWSDTATAAKDTVVENATAAKDAVLGAEPESKEHSLLDDSAEAIKTAAERIRDGLPGGDDTAIQG